LSEHLQKSEAETELIFFSVVVTLVVIWILQLFGGIIFGSGLRQSTDQGVCCVTKFFENRRANRPHGAFSIPPGSATAADNSGSTGLDQFIREVQGQLSAIQKEIQILKHERELMDAELIETSTQILQTIGASFIGAVPGDESLSSRDGYNGTPDSTFPTPIVKKPQPQHVPAPAPVIRQPAAQPAVKPGSPKAHAAPVPAVPKASVQPPKAPSVVGNSPRVVGDPSPKSSAPVHVPVPAQPVPNPNVSNLPNPGPPLMGSGPAKAAPKLSALAQARMKRESEMTAVGGPPQTQAGATNPFGAKARPGPFGGMANQ